MVYYILRILVRLTLQMIFKKVEVTGIENIPKDKQVILLGNHPTAFMEPIILACWMLNRPLNFMIRGDMWKPGFLAWLLDRIHGVPVYRKSEGFSSADANEKTFKRCADIINAKELLIIFAEGSHEMVRRLRPFKKGTSRIVLQALQAKPKEDILAIPVAATYNAHASLRRTVHIDIGEGLPLRQYVSANKPETLLKMTKAMYGHVNQYLPDIDKEEEMLYEKKLYQQAAFGKPFSRQWKDAEKELQRYSTEERSQLAASVTTKDEDLENRTLKSQMRWHHWAALILFAIPAFIGKVLHLPVTMLSHLLSKKFAKKKIFFTSIFTAVSMVTTIVYYILLGIISLLIFGHLWYLLIVVVSGLISLRYFDLWRIATA